MSRGQKHTVGDTTHRMHEWKNFVQLGASVPDWYSFSRKMSELVIVYQVLPKVFDYDAMGINQIKEWYNRFKRGRISVESEERSGRSSEVE